MVAHPSVTLIIDLSEAGGIVCDAHGRHQRGSLSPDSSRASFGPADGGASASRSGCRRSSRLRCSGHRSSSPGPWQRWKMSGAATPGRSRRGCALPRRGTNGSRSRRTSWAGGWAPPIGRSGGRLHLAADSHQPRAGTGSRPGGRGRLEPQAPVVPLPVPDRPDPKRAAQLVRFDHAAHLLAAGHAAASVAAQSGYVDQSHLHREVKAIAGVTPTAVATAPWLAIDDVAWPAAPRHLTPPAAADTSSRPPSNSPRNARSTIQPDSTLVLPLAPRCRECAHLPHGALITRVVHAALVPPAVEALAAA